MTEITENITELAEKLGIRHGQVLLLALKKAQETAAAEPTAANIGALTAAKRALDEAMAQERAPAEKTYRNIQEAVAELQKRGYGVKKSKVYQDANRGRLRRNQDKSISDSALDEYVANPASRLKKPAEVSDVENLRNSSEKLKWETELAREQARERRRKNDLAEGLLMPQEQVHLELAGRAVALEAGFKHDLSVDVPTIMEQADRIADKVERNTFISTRLHGLVDRRLNEYASIGSFLAVIMETEEETSDKEESKEENQ
jgi:hypothetical protein